MIRGSVAVLSILILTGDAAAAQDDPQYTYRVAVISFDAGARTPNVEGQLALANLNAELASTCGTGRRLCELSVIAGTDEAFEQDGEPVSAATRSARSNLQSARSDWVVAAITRSNRGRVRLYPTFSGPIKINSRGNERSIASVDRWYPRARPLRLSVAVEVFVPRGADAEAAARRALEARRDNARPPEEAGVRTVAGRTWTCSVPEPQGPVRETVSFRFNGSATSVVQLSSNGRPARPPEEVIILDSNHQEFRWIGHFQNGGSVWSFNASTRMLKIHQRDSEAAFRWGDCS